VQTVVSVILPFFALVAVGYGAGRWRVLDAGGINGVNRFVFFFALPCLLFAKMAATPVSIVFNATFLAAYITGGLTLFVAAAVAGRLLFRGTLAEGGLLGLAACYGNIGYMGIPLLVAAVGETIAVPLALILTVDLILFVPLGMLVIEIGKGKGESMRHVVRAAGRVLLTNPLVIAIVAGIGVSAAGVTLAGPIVAFTGLLGRTAGPCAMFGLGAVLAGRPAGRGLGTVAYMSIGKLVVHPVVIAGSMTAFGVAAPWSTAAVLAAGMPIAAVLFVIGQQYDVYPERASTAVLASTALSVVTVTVLLLLLRQVGGQV
jgi:predicted permease